MRPAQIEAPEVAVALAGPAQPRGGDARGAANGRLADTVEQHLQRYFDMHGDQLPPPGLYDRIMREVERPLIQIALDAWASQHTRDLIDSFPLQVDELTRVVLATALVLEPRWTESLLTEGSRVLKLHGGLQTIVETTAAGPVVVAGALDEARIEHVADQLPTTLSSGQAQRFALASAMVRPWALLVADEPEQRLDDAGRAWLGDWLAAHAATGRAVLVASHDPDVVARSGARVVQIEGDA